VCKNWLNLPNRLGENVRKPQGGYFESLYTEKNTFLPELQGIFS